MHAAPPVGFVLGVGGMVLASSAADIHGASWTWTVDPDLGRSEGQRLSVSIRPAGTAPTPTPALPLAELIAVGLAGWRRRR